MIYTPETGNGRLASVKAPFCRKCEYIAGAIGQYRDDCNVAAPKETNSLVKCNGDGRYSQITGWCFAVYNRELRHFQVKRRTQMGKALWMIIYHRTLQTSASGYNADDIRDEVNEDERKSDSSKRDDRWWWSAPWRELQNVRTFCLEMVKEWVRYKGTNNWRHSKNSSVNTWGPDHGDNCQNFNIWAPLDDCMILDQVLRNAGFSAVGASSQSKRITDISMSKDFTLTVKRMIMLGTSVNKHQSSFLKVTVHIVCTCPDCIWQYDL